jgi:hypothetical protein
MDLPTGRRRGHGLSLVPRATYTVGAALDDWLAAGLSSRPDRTKELYADTVKPPKERLGDVKLKELTAGDVQETLDTLAARLSTRSLHRFADLGHTLGVSGVHAGRRVRTHDRRAQRTVATTCAGAG